MSGSLTTCSTLSGGLSHCFPLLDLFFLPNSWFWFEHQTHHAPTVMNYRTPADEFIINSYKEQCQANKPHISQRKIRPISFISMTFTSFYLFVCPQTVAAHSFTFMIMWRKHIWHVIEKSRRWYKEFLLSSFLSSVVSENKNAKIKPPYIS